MMDALELELELNSLRALLGIEQPRHRIPLAVQHCVNRRYLPDGGAGRVVVDGTLENVMVAVLLLML